MEISINLSGNELKDISRLCNKLGIGRKDIAEFTAQLGMSISARVSYLPYGDYKRIDNTHLLCKIDPEDQIIDSGISVSSYTIFNLINFIVTDDKLIEKMKSVNSDIYEKLKPFMHSPCDILTEPEIFKPDKFKGTT